jgi:hypothetical protein
LGLILAACLPGASTFAAGNQGSDSDYNDKQTVQDMRDTGNVNPLTSGPVNSDMDKVDPDKQPSSQDDNKN